MCAVCPERQLRGSPTDMGHPAVSLSGISSSWRHMKKPGACSPSGLGQLQVPALTNSVTLSKAFTFLKPKCSQLQSKTENAYLLFHRGEVQNSNERMCKCLGNRVSGPMCGTVIICSMGDYSKCTTGPLTRKPEIV